MASDAHLSTTTGPLLVDRREAGWLLGVSPGTIDNLRTRGELPSVKIATRRLFDVADLRRLVEARKAVAGR
ncbi:MAG: helix-turn-helix domain-containing protein [Phycisphaerales bacterium]|nr:helix-turn-helix domain-containing protein [Phycisphaerales bacterium]